MTIKCLSNVKTWPDLDNHLWSLFYSFVERIANFACSCKSGSFFNKFFVDLFVHKCTWASATTLTHVGKNCVIANGNSFIHCNQQLDYNLNYKDTTLSCMLQSTSGKTTIGLFPPSSKLTRFKLDLAAVSIISLPTLIRKKHLSCILYKYNQTCFEYTDVEPVKAIFWTWAWLVRAAPAVSPKPFTTLITPGGNPA